MCWNMIKPAVAIWYWMKMIFICYLYDFIEKKNYYILLFYLVLIFVEEKSLLSTLT